MFGFFVILAISGLLPKPEAFHIIQDGKYPELAIWDAGTAPTFTDDKPKNSGCFTVAGSLPVDFDEVNHCAGLCQAAQPACQYFFVTKSGPQRGRCCFITAWVPSEGFHSGAQRTRYSRGAFYALAQRTEHEEQAAAGSWTERFDIYCPRSQFNKSLLQHAFRERRAMTSAPSAPPAVSLLSYAQPAMIRETVDNILRFTKTTVVVVHISKTSKHNYSDEDLDMQWLRKQQRVEINPYRRATRWGHGSLLAAHICNFQFLVKKFGIGWQQQGHFIFMADSARMISNGLEAYVKARDGSIPHEQLDLRFNQKWDQWMRPMWDGPGRKFVEALHGLLPGSQPRDPSQPVLTHWNCEGSFYPRALIGRFIAFLERNNLLEVLNDLPTVAEELWLPSYTLVREDNWLSSLRQQKSIPTAITTHLLLGRCPTCAIVQDLLNEKFLSEDQTRNLNRGPDAAKLKFSVKWQWRSHCKSIHKYFMRFISELESIMIAILS